MALHLFAKPLVEFTATFYTFTHEAFHFLFEDIQKEGPNDRSYSRFRLCRRLALASLVNVGEAGNYRRQAETRLGSHAGIADSK